jgi:deoxyribonuclease V
MPRPTPLHDWNLAPKEAVGLQRVLAERVVTRFPRMQPRQIAGADVGFTPDKRFCVAGVVIWDLQAKAVVEERTARRRISFPYVPGLLSFREAPAVLAAIEKLTRAPDVFMFDGQGYAHPRRFGLACHVGLWLDRPSLGCAKSRLTGTHEEPPSGRGGSAPLWDGDERIGLVLRTRDGVRPVYVSVGHRMDLETAAQLVLACGTRYRLPEPTRRADQLVRRATGRA